MLQVYEATLRTAAPAYAGYGLPVFPVAARTKAPATKRGFYDASLNPAAIERWWRAQDYNIGIPTGAPSGVWVLDIDGDEGRESLAALQEKHGALPATVTSVTARGPHLWFAYTGPVPCSTARVAPGVDVKGDGGYAIAPPSVHPTGHVYHWAPDSADVPAPAPEWLIRLARARPRVASIQPTIGHNGPPGAYGQAALDRVVPRSPPCREGHVTARSTLRASGSFSLSPAASWRAAASSAAWSMPASKTGWLATTACGRCWRPSAAPSARVCGSPVRGPRHERPRTSPLPARRD